MGLLNTLITSGKVTYCDPNMDINIPLTHQISTLKEDMLQVEYGSDILLDIGWFPSFAPEGKFQIRIIREYDWGVPVVYAETSELVVLSEVVSCFEKVCIRLASAIG